MKYPSARHLPALPLAIIIEKNKMTKILNYKPYTFLLSFLVVFAISILLFKLWVDFSNEQFKSYGFIIILIGCLAFYFFWIYTLSYGFNMLEKKAWDNGKVNKIGIVILTAFVVSVVGYALFFYFLFELNQELPEYINIPFSLIILYCFLHIVIYLTKNYSFYDKRKSPGIFDYFVTMFLLCFLPFGLLIMHSHLRLILKEKYIIE